MTNSFNNTATYSVEFTQPGSDQNLVLPFDKVSEVSVFAQMLFIARTAKRSQHMKSGPTTSLNRMVAGSRASSQESTDLSLDSFDLSTRSGRKAAVTSVRQFIV